MGFDVGLCKSDYSDQTIGTKQLIVCLHICLLLFNSASKLFQVAVFYDRKLVMSKDAKSITRIYIFSCNIYNVFCINYK